MAQFRAIEKGYYGDIIRDPDNQATKFFDAPDNFKCSWAVKVDVDEAVESEPAKSEPKAKKKSAKPTDDVEVL